MDKIEVVAATIENDLEYLRQISKPVDFLNDKELESDINKLEKYCISHNVMAMAAVQIWILKRIVYLKNTNLEIINKIQFNTQSEEEKNYNEAKILINPVIINRYGLTEYWENCASCLNNCGRVLRPYMIELEYYDLNGCKHTEKFEGFEATVLSHEVDHLDGILHIDIAEEIIPMTPEERKLWRQTHNYKIYRKDGDYIKLRDDKSLKIKKRD